MSSTKGKIISAAIKAFSRNPSAPMEEIAESINLSRRTLHRYFSTRSELITDIVKHASNICLLKTKESIQSSDYPINQLKAMFLSDIESGYQFRFLYKYRDNYQGMEEESKEFEEMMQIFRELLKTLQVNKLVHPQLTLDWIERLYFSTIDAAINLIIEDYSKQQEVSEMAWISYFNAVIGQSN
ncbi:TetR/AcrR family transcriptional regulator [Pontibacter sp. E15-1]|uniref:TetR/AcrR family transcriptional regulator n=1 Tax=Pontibacter sp. E15-1 TaxID=2919918 RepID=UPI001F4F2D70|nr:TetR/AcrR family transcriptional regulator [Pontibacter sp. E15-1]MCJ8167046.1 TetR/AcrR family transcriptional regulator [Pontibacter sp. E15-1]